MGSLFNLMDMEIAQIILQQLGGRQFLAMTGAHTLLNVGNGLSFKLKSRSVNYVKILLNGLDTYDVTFAKINTRTWTVTEVAQMDGIYADQLRPIFTQVTGLDTRL